MDFDLLQGETEHRDSSFLVWNMGGLEDSLTVSLDYVNVSPESAITVSPTTFVLPPDSSQTVTVGLRPNMLAPMSYNAIVLVDSWRSSGPSQLSVLVKFHVATTGMEEDGPFPQTYALYQNYPNPFNPSTTIEFDLPHSGFITLKVYNVLGEEVATLMEEDRAPGTFSVTWSASEVPSGVYLYRLTAGNYVQTMKMLLIK